MANWSSGRAQDTRSVFGFTVSLTPASTAGASAVEQAFTITGVPGLPLMTTDHVAVGGPGSGNNVSIGGCRVNSSNQLVIQFINPTAGTLTHAAGSFFVKVSRL